MGLLMCLLCALAVGVPMKRIHSTSGDISRRFPGYSGRVDSSHETSARFPVSGGRIMGFYSMQLQLDRQILEVLVDTGSSLLGVVGSTCRDIESHKSCPAPQGIGFKPKSSQAVSCGELPGCCKGSGASSCVASVGYLDGTAAQGPVYKVQASFQYEGNATALEVFVGVMSKERGHFSSLKTHGILGLGVVPTQSIPDFLSIMAQEGLSPVVSACFSDEGGELTFGEPDLSKTTTGHILYTPVQIPKTDWAVNVSSMQVDGADTSASISLQGLHAVVDTGTTVLIVPKPILDKLVMSLKSQCSSIRALREFFCNPNGKSIFDVPSGQCLPFSESIFDSLPDIVLTIGDSIIVRIPGRNYIRWEERSGHKCGMFAIMAIPAAPRDLMLLGDTFLRSSYVVFDRANMRVGFAPSVNCTAQFAVAGGRTEAWRVILIVAAALIVGSAIFFIYVMMERRKRSQAGEGAPSASIWPFSLFSQSAVAQPDNVTVSELRLAALERREEEVDEF